MAAHSGVLAWRIPWTEEIGGLQSIASQRVGHIGRDLVCMRDSILLFIYSAGPGLSSVMQALCLCTRALQLCRVGSGARGRCSWGAWASSLHNTWILSSPAVD